MTNSFILERMNYLPQEIEHWLSMKIGTIDSFHAISGGCINYTGSILTKKGSYFIKWNNSQEFPEIFQKEAKGLDLLRMGILRVPEVIDVFEGNEYSCLLLENIQSAVKSKDYWTQLGEGLAFQHKIPSEIYGLEYNNYMGSLPQINSTSQNWLEFFISNRLKPQVKLARDNNLIDSKVSKDFDSLYTKLDNVLYVDPPALVHGDLWNGNIMSDNHGFPVLIDPATYYGNREVDLAMTHLFGGFEHQFYEAYRSNYPLIGDLESRIDIYNLYPLLIHLNLFGRGYLGQILSILKRFNY